MLLMILKVVEDLPSLEASLGWTGRDAIDPTLPPD
jgi:hypothetical protein